jgi:hypothetical protein
MTYQAPISPDARSLQLWGSQLRQQLERTRADDLQAREELREEIASARAALDALRAELADFGDVLQLLGGENLDDDDLGLIGGIEAFRRKLKREVAAVFAALRVNLDETLDWVAATTDELIGEAPPLLDIRDLLERLQIETGENVARLTTEINTRINEDEALASSIETLQAGLDGGLAAITTQLNTIVDEQTAQATSITALVTQMDAAEAAIVTEQTTRATADTALALSITTMQAEVDDAHARITTEETVRAGADSALATRVGRFETVMGDTTAAITSYIGTRITDGIATSTVINSLRNTIDGVGAGLTELREVTVGPGGTNSRWAITTDTITGGQRAINGMISLGTTNGVTDFNVIADRVGFWMMPRPGSPDTAPEPIFGWRKRDGVAKMALIGDFIADGTIKADRIETASLKAFIGEFVSIIADKITSRNGKMSINLATGQMRFIT